MFRRVISKNQRAIASGIRSIGKGLFTAPSAQQQRVIAASASAQTKYNFRFYASDSNDNPYKKYEEELGDKPKFLRDTERGANKAALLLAAFAVFPFFLLPWYVNYTERKTATEGHQGLKEYEEYRRQKKLGNIQHHGAHHVHSVSEEREFSVSDNAKTSTNIACHYKYILVGTGTASYAALKAIKEKDPEAEVLIVGSEAYPPYQRPPLSKELWKSDDPNVADNLTFTNWNGKQAKLEYEPLSWYSEENRNITLLLNHNVEELDITNKTIRLDNGRVFSYDKCLLATGGTPKQIPGVTTDLQDHVTTFRNVQDFKNLDAVTRKGGRIAVLGGSFLGSELAYALASRGEKLGNLDVIQIFPEPGVLARNLPRYLSEAVTEKLQSAGVQIRNHRMVTSVRKHGDKVLIKMDNDEEIEADHVVVAIGINPNNQLAAKAGLELDFKNGGIVTNSELEARNNIWAAGDVVSYYDMTLGRRRVEHYEHAYSTGRHAGLNMATDQHKPFQHISMFWSDIGDLGFEACGEIDSDLDTYAVWNNVNVFQQGTAWFFNAKPRHVTGYNKGVVYYLRDKKVVGVLLWRMPGKISEARKIINSGEIIENVEELSSKIKL